MADETTDVTPPAEAAPAEAAPAEASAETPAPEAPAPQTDAPAEATGAAPAAPAPSAAPSAPSAPSHTPSYQGGGSAMRRPGGGKRFPRRKVCAFCVDKVDYIDYKDIKRLRKFVTERGKILPRRISGNCAAHQRLLTTALKRARVIALVAYTTD